MARKKKRLISERTVLNSAQLSPSATLEIVQVWTEGATDTDEASTQLEALVRLSDGTCVRVGCMAELVTLANDHGIRLTDAARDDPIAFARLVGPIETDGRFIELPELYGFADRQFEIAVVDECPRVAGDVLHLLAIKASLDGEHALWRVNVDLVSGHIEREAVRRRQSRPGTPDDDASRLRPPAGGR